MVSVMCNTSGGPPFSGRWTKDGQTVWNGNELTFKPIHRRDAGTYRFTMKNGDECKKAEKVVNVTVYYKPESSSIKISGDKHVFCEGDSMHVTCTSHAKPAPVYSLYRNHVFLGSNAIGVFHVTLAEKGNYTFTCVPNNAVGVGSNKSDTIKVKEPPKIIDCRINGSLNGSQPVIEGDVITVTCRRSGSPPFSERWTKDGRGVWQGNDLTFNPIHRQDAGTYKFIVNNGDVCNEADQDISIFVYYLDPLEVIGSSNQSYSQSNPLVLFNLSINAYPSNTSLSCIPSAPNILTAITSHDAELNTKQYLVFVIIKNTVDSASIVCKAENSVGVREKTLHFYKRPIPFKENFAAQFRITNQEWQDELTDSKSAAYKNLEKKCISVLQDVYNATSYLVAINIKGFLKGSIIVQFELVVIGLVPDPLQPLRDYIKEKGGETNGLQIDYNSIQKSSDFNENKPNPTAGKHNQTIVAVLGGLFGLSIVVIIILTGVIFCLRKKDSKTNSGKRSNNEDERGQINDIALQETGFNKEIPNVPEYEPVGRQGLTTSNVGIPQYEAVATRTQATQPQSGVQTNNPIPQYESADQHGQTGAVSNPPAVTYQTIQPRTDNYGSLNPQTRIPPKGTPTGSPTRTGEYQALQHKGVSPQYQSLDDLSRC